jgi:hypothetical protein
MTRLSIFVAIAILSADAHADEASPDSAAIQAAIAKSVPVLQEAARTFRERSEGRCISCHHQGLVLQTVALTRERGYAIAEHLARAEVERVHGFYARRRGRYADAIENMEARKAADPYGNFTVHAGYWLWGLAAEKLEPDDVTATTARLLAARQSADGRWTFEDTARAPMQASDFTTTALAAFVLRHYGAKDDAEMAVRIARARDWLLDHQPRTTDDKAFRLFGLHWTVAQMDRRKQAVEELLAEQGPDGGWAQQANMPTDAYATGLAMVALRQAGDLPASGPSYQRGVAYLLRTQQKDGTWFVKTRAIPSNPYFESGFPYGKSQFISYAGSCWATMALALTQEPVGSND